MATVAYGLGQLRVNKEYQQTVTLQAEIMATLKLIDRLMSLKTPTGFMSNLKSKISPDGTLFGLKSHDYHVLLQQVIPVCIRGLLPERVEKTMAG